MIAKSNFKKQIKVNVKTNCKGQVVLKYPKQSIGTVWFESVNGVLVEQYALIVSGKGELRAEKL